jgi:glyoxylase-like metal-dependent hydrolase (beta-lactamase superfamily II)
MKIAEGLEMLEIRGSMFDTEGVYCPTLIWDENEVVLFDACLPGERDAIREAFIAAGAPFEKLSKIFITHHDGDHIGSLSALVRGAGAKIEVLSHEGEKPYIEGKLRPIKMTPEKLAQLEAMIKTMPEDKQIEYKNMRGNISTEVDTTIYDGQELPFCGGIQVVHTPGHTPGHTCFYLKKYKALVTGDAMNVVDGKLVGPNPQYTYKPEEALKSLEKLSNYDIQTVICYHGGLFNDNPNQRIKEIAAGK